MKNIIESNHYKNDRQERSRIIKEEIGGYGRVLFTAKVDKGHPAGPEYHKITANGIIYIENARTHKHVTDLIARPKQLLKYGFYIPEDTMEIAAYHVSKGWNYV